MKAESSQGSDLNSEAPSSTLFRILTNPCNTQVHNIAQSHVCYQLLRTKVCIFGYDMIHFRATLIFLTFQSFRLAKKVNLTSDNLTSPVPVYFNPIS